MSGNTLTSLLNQIVPLKNLYEIVHPETADYRPSSRAVPLAYPYDSALVSSSLAPAAPDRHDPLPRQPSYPSSTSNAYLPGDRFHRRHHDWAYGKHSTDISLWDKGGFQVESMSRYKSNLLPKGLNTPAAVLKEGIAPRQTATTSTKHFEHQWIVAKAVGPSDASVKEIWIASWKDFDGNIQTHQYSSLEAANRAASSTRGNDAGEGIRKLEDLDGSGFTVGGLIEYIRSIQAGYHLTLRNCIDYANEMMSALKDHKFPSNPNPVFSSRELQAAANSPSSDAKPSPTYEFREVRTHLGRRKVQVIKDGRKIHTVKAKHFDAAREKAELLTKDDINRDKQTQEAMNSLKKKLGAAPIFNSGAKPPEPPQKPKLPEYGTREFGPKGSRKVEVFDKETGTVVSRFTAKHSWRAREEANRWAKDDLKGRQDEHAQAVKDHEQDLEHYRQQQKQHQRKQAFNQVKTGVASAATMSILRNGERLIAKAQHVKIDKEDMKAFGIEVAKDTAIGGAVTVLTTGISSVVPYYSTGCACIRSARDGSVRYANGEGAITSFSNPATKIGLNVLPGVLFGGLIVANPIIGGIALGVYSVAVDKIVDEAFQ